VVNFMLSRFREITELIVYLHLSNLAVGCYGMV
jgi:hypothetical protein